MVLICLSKKKKKKNISGSESRKNRIMQVFLDEIMERQVIRRLQKQENTI